MHKLLQEFKMLLTLLKNCQKTTECVTFFGQKRHSQFLRFWLDAFREGRAALLIFKILFEECNAVIDNKIRVEKSIIKNARL